MCKIYKDTPENFNDIEPYVSINSEDVVKRLIQSEKCYFYDTCSFRKHMIIDQPESIFDYVKQTNGVVVITRCIIMELCSNDNKLWVEHIEYIKKMHQSGLYVIVMFEEDFMDVLNFCFTGVTTTNGMLSIAVKHAKSKTGTVEKILSIDSALKKELLVDDTNSDKTLAKRFFGKVRLNKTSEDNLGEELISICVHMLSNIREEKANKYIVLSDDKGAITLLGKTMQNVEKYMGMKCITGVTTAKLCWLIENNLHFSSKEQIENILGNPDENIKVYCSEEYELMPSEKTFKVSELAQKLIGGSIKIYS